MYKIEISKYIVDRLCETTFRSILIIALTYTAYKMIHAAIRDWGIENEMTLNILFIITSIVFIIGIICNIVRILILWNVIKIVVV